MYGMPTMIETDTLTRCAEVCRDLKLDFVELNINFPQYQLSRLDAGELNRLAGEYGIGYTIHLDDEMSIADFNGYVAEGYQKTVLDAIELAKQIGAKVLNMHMSRGAKYTLPDRVVFFFEAYEEEYLEKIRAFRDACTQAIGDSGILICVENTNGFLPWQQRAVELLLESPVFGLTFDIGHNYCASDADEAWILAHMDRLRHFHIHDAKDGRKDHLALGKGELDARRYLTLAERCGATVVLETKTVAGLGESVDYVRDWQHSGN